MDRAMRMCAQIDTSALKQNIINIKKLIPWGVKVMPVIKADAYGHGAAEVAAVLEPFADYFAVAIIEEAEALRKNGVNKPIMMLGYCSPQCYERALKNNITLTVFSYEDAKVLSEKAQEMGKTATVHIAADTGMSRIGFACNEESAEIIKNISELTNIDLEGIFTHFAAADEADRSFTNLQAKRFSDLLEILDKKGVNIRIRHASNSAAIMEYPELRFDMVRAGIIVYGLYPSDEVKKEKLFLKPAMQLISKVIYVKDIYEGDTVSYGRTFTAKGTMRVATVPVGYADGYPRLLSNRGRVLINGAYAPIIGRVCMDQFMVDVTDIDNVRVGDTVTLFGKQGGCEISVDEVAKHAETINYEIICTIGKRVPRVYT